MVAAPMGEELAASRAYARSALAGSHEEIVRGCVDALRLYGFCVLGAWTHSPTPPLTTLQGA